MGKSWKHTAFYSLPACATKSERETPAFKSSGQALLSMQAHIWVLLQKGGGGGDGGGVVGWGGECGGTPAEFISPAVGLCLQDGNFWKVAAANVCWI